MIRAARSGRFAFTSYRPRRTLAPRRAATAIGVTHTAASVGIGSCQTFSVCRSRPCSHGGGPSSNAEDNCNIHVTYVVRDGSEVHVKGREGQNLLELAHEHGVDLEGACECSIACSTCHVYVNDEYYDLIPEPCEDEEDMLDMAFALRDTSRLGCCIELTSELDGITVKLPSATRNFYVDGHVPQPH